MILFDYMMLIMLYLFFSVIMTELVHSVVDEYYDGDVAKVTVVLVLLWPVTIAIAVLVVATKGLFYVGRNVGPIARGAGRAAIYPALCVKEVARFAVKAGQS